MSYYYEDMSQYRYSMPAHYEDTPQYSYSVPAHREDVPHYYYYNMSAHLVDSSQYSFSVPAHYRDNDTTPNPVYHTPSYNDNIYSEPTHSNNVTAWSLRLSSGIEHARELEAYAEDRQLLRPYTTPC
jgi:hypothetical protein